MSCNKGCLSDFKFQSDSINTMKNQHDDISLDALNSNLILLIHQLLIDIDSVHVPLNSNLILLIRIGHSVVKVCVKIL